MTYNLTLVNGTGILAITQTVNSELTFGFFGIMLLVAISLIGFLSFYRFTNDGIRSMNYALFIGAVSSLPLRALSLVNDLSVFITWILLGIMVFLLYVTEN